MVADGVARTDARPRDHHHLIGTRRVGTWWEPFERDQLWWAVSTSHCVTPSANQQADQQWTASLAKGSDSNSARIEIDQAPRPEFESDPAAGIRI